MIKIVEWSERIRCVRISLEDLKDLVSPRVPAIDVIQYMQGGKVSICLPDATSFHPDSAAAFINKISQAAIFAETLRFAYEVPESADLAKRLIESFGAQP